MNKSFLLSGILALAATLPIGMCNAQTTDTLELSKVQEIVTGIREAALSHQPHPLPLAAHWNSENAASERGRDEFGFVPQWQLEQIAKGHHLLPWFSLPGPARNQQKQSAPVKAMREKYYRESLQEMARLNLPITLKSTQWEQQLSIDPKYFGLPAEQNPNVVKPDGEVLKRLSAFGPVKLWREVGRSWTDTPMMKKIQEWYPNPPLVILLSNNEASKLTPSLIEEDSRYLAKYDKGRSDEFKRKVLAEGWIERYKALQEGMLGGLANENWKRAVKFIGYNAFGPSYAGRMAGWQKYSPFGGAQHSTWTPYYWDGTTSSYYTAAYEAETDFQVNSPQIASMNWIFMQREAQEIHPGFWFEISVWDGFDNLKSLYGPDKVWKQPKPEYYRSLGQTYDPTRYEGYVQFGMWLLRPRSVREYRAFNRGEKYVPNYDAAPYFQSVVNAVDRVWKIPVLADFWQHAKLVPNRAHPHPYQQAIPEEWKKEDRWFMLDTNLDPPRPWKLDTEIPVLSLALVEGKISNRRWLVYAHSPLQDHKNVEITIPEYGKITVDVPGAGAFYVVDEKSKTVQPV